MVAAKDQEPGINRDSYEPAYQQLANLFKSQIAAGQYRPGSKLPAEAEICRKYKVSPMTVRRAIGILLDRGVVTTTRGRGTFVKSVELTGSSFSLDALVDLINGDQETRVKMLEASITVADDDSSTRLGLELGDYLIHVRRLILRREEPVLFHCEHMIYDPRRPLVEGELDATSLKGFFTGSGETDIKNGVLTVNSSLLEADEAAVLQRPARGPCFRFEHTFYDFDDRPLSSGWFICPADKLHFTAHIGHFED